jgi:hypothetical protein
MKSEALTALGMKIVVFWDVMSHALVDRYQHLEELAASIFRVH